MSVISLTIKFLMLPLWQFLMKLPVKQSWYFFVPDDNSEKNLEPEISDFIAKKIGKLAKPKFLFQLPDLP